MVFRLDPIKDREFLEKRIDAKTGKTLAQLLDEAPAPRVETREPSRAPREPVSRRVAEPLKCYEIGTKFTITLAYPPSVNNVYATVVVSTDPVRTKRVLTKAGREYKKLAKQQALSQGAFVLDGRVSLTIHVFRPRRSGDLSNRIKITEDSLTGIAYPDDEEVAQFHIYRHLSPKNPRVEITVEKIKNNRA